MSPDRREPRVVAELGRPETPEETAARKAGDSRAHRERQTFSNLVYALLATLALVVIIVLIVPRPSPSAPTRDVDYRAAARQAGDSEPDPLAAPVVPSSWRANEAEIRSASGTSYWYVGFVTGDRQYVGLSQGFDADDAWTEGQLNRTAATGTTTIDGVRWTVYDHRDDGQAVDDIDYGLTTAAGRSTFALYGTASPANVRLLAGSLAPAIRADARGAGAAATPGATSTATATPTPATAP